MVKIVVAVIAGMLVWLALATIGGLAMRGLWAAYVVAEPRFAFTLPLQLARLSIGAGSTISAGWLTARTTGGNRHAALALGVTLLLFFLPNHYYLRDKFPLWYHVTFLASLVPLTLLGQVWPAAASSAPRQLMNWISTPDFLSWCCATLCRFSVPLLLRPPKGVESGVAARG